MDRRGFLGFCYLASGAAALRAAFPSAGQLSQPLFGAPAEASPLTLESWITLLFTGFSIVGNQAQYNTTHKGWFVARQKLPKTIANERHVEWMYTKNPQTGDRSVPSFTTVRPMMSPLDNGEKFGQTVEIFPGTGLDKHRVDWTEVKIDLGKTILHFNGPLLKYEHDISKLDYGNGDKVEIVFSLDGGEGVGVMVLLEPRTASDILADATDAGYWTKRTREHPYEGRPERTVALSLYGKELGREVEFTVYDSLDVANGNPDTIAGTRKLRYGEGTTVYVVPGKVVIVPDTSLGGVSALPGPGPDRCSWGPRYYMVTSPATIDFYTDNARKEGK